MKHGYPVKGSYKKTQSYVIVSLTAQGTAICLKPPTHNFTEDEKYFRDH